MADDIRRGKYFLIRSQACMGELVAEVEGGQSDKGVRVVLGQAPLSGHAASHQLWYLDLVTNTVRNKRSGLCLEFGDDQVVVVNPYRTTQASQRFRRSDQMIHLVDNVNEVASVNPEMVKQGSPLCLATQTGLPSQKWVFEHMPPEFFLIWSHDGDHVLCVDGARKSPGTKVILDKHHKTPPDHQLWYENEAGVICSKLTGFQFGSTGGFINMCPCDPPQHAEQKQEEFIVYDNSIRNRLDIDEAIEAELKKIDKSPGFAKFGRKISGAFGTNQKLKKATFTGAINQVWRVDSVATAHAK